MNATSMTVEEDLNRRLRRFAITSLVMFVAALAALGHLAAQLKARAAVSTLVASEKWDHAR